METLQGHLEEYLKREGLLGVISEHRRPVLENPALRILWVAAIWIPAACLLLLHRGLKGVLAAVTMPPLLFLAFMLGMAVFFLIKRLRLGKSLSDADSGTIGGFLLVGFPVLMTVVLGLYLKSWSAIGWYTLSAVVGTALVILACAQPYRVRLLFELARSVFRVLLQSVSLLPLLAPVLLIVVLLSIYSQELWEAVGGLSPVRFIASTLLLFLPAALLVATSLRTEAVAIVGEFPEYEAIIECARLTPFIKRKLDGGYISGKDWERIERQFEWRHKTTMAADLLPVLLARIRRWRALQLGLTGAGVGSVLSLYFFVLFQFLLTPQVVSSWTGVQPDTLLEKSLHFLDYSWRFQLLTTAIPVAKVSLLLAVVVAVMSIIYALTDESIKTISTSWLREKAASWLAVSALYQSVSSPNYQVWDFIVRNKRDGIANVSIVVPRGLSEEEVEKACSHVESHLREYRHLVVVTAYVQNAERPIYRLGMPGDRWRLLHNKSKGEKTFEAIPLELDEPRYQDFLGMESLEKGETVPDTWFGNSTRGMAIGRAIWEEGADHELVLHPYAHDGGGFLALEIHLTRRLGKSVHYRSFIRTCLGLARQKAPDAQNISIDLYFRDGVDMLAHLDWSTQLQYVKYRDETSDRSSIERPGKWV